MDMLRLTSSILCCGKKKIEYLEDFDDPFPVLMPEKHLDPLKDQGFGHRKTKGSYQCLNAQKGNLDEEENSVQAAQKILLAGNSRLTRLRPAGLRTQAEEWLQAKREEIIETVSKEKETKK
ncbi:hypothetical protein J0S82_016954 [Galemys pyrenaicus]|uniref:Uncharacterized protein n=1 Tax=Galemys pyrenaicus TaxID=202257 RepID=A0A8J6DGZ2_GALPY|nr:hypothetical protein J0S82_016954 [Galemys pyrenaicus]